MPRSPGLPLYSNEPDSPPSRLSLLAIVGSRAGLRYLLAGFASLSLFLFFVHGPPPRPHFPFLRDGPSQWPHHHWPDEPFNPGHPGDRPPVFHPGTPGSGHNDVWSTRADAVKAAFVHAYGSYKSKAFPHDELLPLTRKHVDNFNGWGVSLVDGLDTMIIMGLDEEVNQSITHVAKMKLDQDQYIPFFESIIRYLGGLISSYYLTGNTILITRADEMAQRLLPAFNETTGLPDFAINMKTGVTRDGWNIGKVIFSEIASFQMEFRALAHLTGRADYVHVADRVIRYLRDLHPSDGLYPLTYYKTDGKPADARASVGAFADSSYEYLLKQWLLSNRTESSLRDMYVESATGIINRLLYLSPERGLLYVTDTNHGAPSGTFEHLSCFLAGTLALGAYTIPDLPKTHMYAAEGLAHTCWITYADQPSGLGPDEMQFKAGTNVTGLWITAYDRWQREGTLGDPPGVGQATPVLPGEPTEYSVRSSRYLLRPETVESFFILWKITGDVRWRERGWAIFEAIERTAKMTVGYASLSDVRKEHPVPINEMPSFFLAETLKYLYLLFIEDDLIPLDRFVFNTEAHPFPVFAWSDWEKDYFNISSH